MPVFKSKIDGDPVVKRHAVSAALGALALALSLFTSMVDPALSQERTGVQLTRQGQLRNLLPAQERSQSPIFARDRTNTNLLAQERQYEFEAAGSNKVSSADEIAASVPEQSGSAADPSRPGFRRYLPGDFSSDDLRRRPLLYFRIWANKPLPPVLSFLFLLFITVVASELMPARMAVARRYCASHYWRSFWTGIVSCLLFTTLARALFVSEIGLPLAIGSMAVLQFFVLIGVTVSSTLIGQTILSIVGFKDTPAVKRQWFARLGAPLVGSLLLALLLVIPPLGVLPRIGIRLIMLLSFLGMGAWFRTEMGTKELGGSSET
ncbi:MAG TPA: hypothetical protein V6C89_00940 [Drouetiella sp.]|jgi:hypothetical protein